MKLPTDLQNCIRNLTDKNLNMILRLLIEDPQLVYVPMRNAAKEEQKRRLDTPGERKTVTDD